MLRRGHFSLTTVLVCLSGMVGFCGLDSQADAQTTLFSRATRGNAKANDGKRTQPEPGRLVHGKPVGLFYMQKYWMATRSLEKSCWYFTANGHVYLNPSRGFTAKELQSDSSDHGTFSISGNQLTVKWSDGKQSTAEMEIEKTGFYWDTGSFLAVEPFKDASIEGTYSGGSSMSFAGASTMIAKTLQLHRDGTFAFSGMTSMRTDTESKTDPRDSEFYAGGGSETQGTWQLDGFFLVLQNQKGESVQHVVFPFDDKETEIYPDRLFMGGIMYKKE